RSDCSRVRSRSPTSRSSTSTGTRRSTRTSSTCRRKRSRCTARPCGTLSAGIWFENMLNQSLLRDIMHKDPTAKATHYALTELGDETRHMVMFGKAIERVGARPVQPRLYHRVIINTLPFFFRG